MNQEQVLKTLGPLLIQLRHSAQASDLTQAIPNLKNDPIEIPRSFSDPMDIEIMAFLSALLAYGRVPLFKAVLKKLVFVMQGRPEHYLRHFEAEKEKPRFKGIYYRFNTSDDLYQLCKLLSQVLNKHGSLGQLFNAQFNEKEPDIAPTLARFIAELRTGLPQPLSRGLSYLLPSPERGSACKRLFLFLRWMVRPDDGLDFGLWTQIPANKLLMPMDTHIVRISGYLGFSQRKTPSLIMSREVTAVLRQYCPEDPLSFDFALCHLGISQACPKEADAKKCEVCLLKSTCQRGRALAVNGV